MTAGDSGSFEIWVYGNPPLNRRLWARILHSLAQAVEWRFSGRLVDEALGGDDALVRPRRTPAPGFSVLSSAQSEGTIREMSDEDESESRTRRRS